MYTTTEIVAAVQASPSAAEVSQNLPKAKATKRRFSKLTAAEVSGLPGVNVAAAKKVEPDLAYWIIFALPVSGLIGTTAEVTQAHAFADRLDVQAKATGIGAVTAVTNTNGVAEIVLKLTAEGDQASHGAPAANAFAQLGDFFRGASVLTHGHEGKAAIWKAKVNGTTIADGKF